LSLDDKKQPEHPAPLQTLRSSESSPQLRRHYLQNLVHELSSPLTPLLGYLQLFNNGSLGELTGLQQRSMERMHHAANRLQWLLDDVASLLQMESGMYQIEPTPLSLALIIEHAIDRTREMAEEQKIEVLLEMSLGDETVRGDEPKLCSAFEHLVSNGLKFNSAGGKLMIRGGTVLDAGPHRVRIEIFDSGIGIKAEDMDRVFEPFFQSDHSTTRRFEGAGLGLPLVRWIIEGHEGTIELESPPSVQPEGHFFRGVRAIVELPLG
jgi:signal transduction histidine kinase